MTTTSRLAAVSILFLVLASGPSRADDWPQWRGQQRDGRSAETGLLDTWPAGGPPLAWKSSGLGGGFSSVSVVGDRVYTMGDLADGQYVLALSRADGSHLWKTRVGDRHQDEYLGPRSTPTVDGDRLYVETTAGDVVALEAADGKLIWKRSLPADLGGDLMKAKGSWDWRFAESPLIDGDRVIVTPGAKDAALVALDKRDGKEVWRTRIPDLGPAGEDGAAYSSPVVGHGAGVRQIVQLVGRGAIGVDAATGRFLWGYNRIANGIANIPTPLVDGDHVFVSTGYGTGSALLRLEPTEDGVAAHEVYFLPGETMQNHHGGLILDDGVVYTGTGHNKGFPLALEMATGEVLWGPVRNEGRDSAAIAYADDRLVFRYQNGLVILVEASPEGYREHGSFQIPGVEQPSWPHPVIADGKLYLREQDTLYVHDLRPVAPAAPAATGGS